MRTHAKHDCDARSQAAISAARGVDSTAVDSCMISGSAEGGSGGGCSVGDGAEDFTANRNSSGGGEETRWIGSRRSEWMCKCVSTTATARIANIQRVRAMMDPTNVPNDQKYTLETADCAYHSPQHSPTHLSSHGKNNTSKIYSSTCTTPVCASNKEKPPTQNMQLSQTLCIRNDARNLRAMYLAGEQPMGPMSYGIQLRQKRREIAARKAEMPTGTPVSFTWWFGTMRRRP